MSHPYRHSSHASAGVECVVFSHPALTEPVNAALVDGVAAECARNVHFSARPPAQLGTWSR
ncbi:hypothetical protein [Saccharomonospora cyanea]|uniref:Uncharacterized protein n=1 Tax=Saccharomonospora cyanea NA-134 TaxID=882082 RepID=H5XQD8_9PSEU|nr:hypothetical protein [Saccharomonospora cyanea]EHR63871.1 hypothetical protein SaccyDRAFT_5077 [Saccharomonospora cyanea NA-134]